MIPFPSKPNSRRITRSQVYPFRDLVPGQAADIRYPLDELHRLRSSVSYYRKKLKLDLRISIVDDAPGKTPYAIVGIPVSEDVAGIL